VNTTDIIPITVPNAGTYNSVAEAIGLHDFYQNSMWGFCEGYNPDNVTSCSKPSAMYTFDIVQIFDDQLLTGYNVTIPADIENDLNQLRTASHWMFALYLVGVIFIALTVLTGLLALCFFFGSILAVFVSFLAIVFWGAATILAQITFIIYRDAINNTITQLNVSAKLGTTMFAFSWVAAVCVFVAFFGFCFGSCCGTGESGSRRRGWRREKYYEP
jgi:SUR7/PalI family